MSGSGQSPCRCVCLWGEGDWEKLLSYPFESYDDMTWQVVTCTVGNHHYDKKQMTRSAYTSRSILSVSIIRAFQHSVCKCVFNKRVLISPKPYTSTSVLLNKPSLWIHLRHVDVVGIMYIPSNSICSTSETRRSPVNFVIRVWHRNAVAEAW